MTNYIKIFFLLCIVVLAQSCSDSADSVIETQKVQFSFGASSSNARVASTTLPTGTKLRVSVVKTSGETMFTFKEIELLNVGGVLTTAPIELPFGSYKVTDFVLVNEAQRIILATPKRGSAMAALVKNPVSYSFGVKKGQTTSVAMEVVDALHSLAEDFGYVTFDLDLTHALKIGVYAPALATAQAYILQGTDTLQYFNLAATTNELPFTQATDQSYTLTIIKDGFARYTRQFVYNDLIASLAGQPLKVTLNPAFTFRAAVKDDLGKWFHAKVNGVVGGNISVDWGDGSAAQYPFTSADVDGYNVDLEHTYANEGSYFVTVTGDLTKITSYYSYYGEARYKTLNLEKLTMLKNLSLGLIYAPDYLDLTHNTKLENVDLEGLYTTSTIKLPFFNKIAYINVGGPNKLSAGSLTDIINTVHHAAVADNRHNGTFVFIKDVWEGNEGMVKTPTPAALAKLRVLRDTYGWSIYPNP